MWMADGSGRQTPGTRHEARVRMEGRYRELRVGSAKGPLGVLRGPYGNYSFCFPRNALICLAQRARFNADAPYVIDFVSPFVTPINFEWQARPARAHGNTTKSRCPCGAAGRWWIIFELPARAGKLARMACCVSTCDSMANGKSRRCISDLNPRMIVLHL